jgi:hypothetical protein
MVVLADKGLAIPSDPSGPGFKVKNGLETDRQYQREIANSVYHMLFSPKLSSVYKQLFQPLLTKVNLLNPN